MDGSKNYIEKRAKTRRDLSWDAAIVDSFGQPVSRCCVVNISATGAQLLLQEAAELPEDFTLLLSHKGEVRRQCRVAWQDDKNVGVSFVRSRSAARDAQRRSTTDRPESRG